MPSRFNTIISRNIEIEDVNNLENRLNESVADHTGLQTDITNIETNITNIESDITDIQNELFYTDTNDTSYDGEWDPVKSYGNIDFDIEKPHEITITATASSDSGIHCANVINTVRNNYSIGITAKSNNSSAVVILSFGDIPFINNQNHTQTWPLPNYSRGFVLMLQHHTPTGGGVNWLRSTESPNTNNLITNNVLPGITLNQKFIINITNGIFSFHKLDPDGITIDTYTYANPVSLPLGKYYVGIHIQSSGNNISKEYELKLAETAITTPYSIINEIKTPKLNPQESRYVIKPSIYNPQAPKFYCDENVRHVTTNALQPFTLVMPLPNTSVKKDTLFTVKNIANNSVSLELPIGYRWSDSYTTNNYTLGNHKTITIRYMPYDRLGDWGGFTSSTPLKLCDIVNETTRIINP